MNETPTRKNIPKRSVILDQNTLKALNVRRSTIYGIINNEFYV